MTAKQQTINCSERLSLGQKLGQAINYAYAARTDYETAKASKADPDRLAHLLGVLQDARTEELNAERAYRQHTDAHGCLKPEWRDSAHRKAAAAAV